MSSISPQGNSLSLERWRSYAGVSWGRPRNGADPAPFADSVNSPICGVHFDAKGRVFVSIPGHYTWTFDDPLFRVLLLRGIAWTAGESVDRFNELATLGARLSD